MQPELVVMAAGMGSRFGGLKQLAAVGPSGERLADYALFDAHRAGIERVVFVIRRELERDIHAAFGSRCAKVMDVAYAFQELSAVPTGFVVKEGRTTPWGTGHAVLSAKNAVHGPFIVINADDFYGPQSFRILVDHLTSPNPLTLPSDHAMLAFRLRNTLSEHGVVSRGICDVDGAGFLSGLTEHRALRREGTGAVEQLPNGELTSFTGDERVSMNFWGFRPTVFQELELAFEAFLRSQGADQKSELPLPGVIDALIRARRGRVQVLESPETWFGVTYPGDHATVAEHIRKLVLEGFYPPALWE